MTFLNWELIEDQLDEIDDLSVAQKNLVRTLLYSVDKNDAIIMRDGKVADVVQTLARGHLFVDPDDGNWIDLVPGEFSVRDIVRVKTDGYDGTHGTIHNGRRGRITAIRNGVSTVVYDDQPVDSAIGHNWNVLQKLV